MSLAPYVQILGRGVGRARSFTHHEAYEAMQFMLRDDQSAEATGAILMLLRMKGEIAEEIAGFTQAAQDAISADKIADLDWPCYAAGRTRGAPWFLHSALDVSQSGKRVLLHGWNGQDQAIREGLSTLGITVSGSLDEANAVLQTDGITYLPLEQLHPQLFALLRLRDVLGLRSCVNTVCRMLNPGRASASVQGVFHPSYRLLQADAAVLLGWNALSVIKGGGGEFERHPGKLIEAFGLRDGELWQALLPALSRDTTRLQDHTADLTRPDKFAQDIIAGTTALALDTLGANARDQAA